MIFPLERYHAFSRHLSIPSKEEGVVPFRKLGTQAYLVQEIARGLEEDVHSFITLKGRQQGYSTEASALDLFWCLDHSGIQGLMVEDTDDNLSYRRDIIREMLATLPPAYQLPIALDNEDMLRWGTVPREEGQRFGGSRLMYQVAGKSRRSKGRIGRSRGVNYLDADEVGWWTDQKGIGSLEASLAEYHPLRLYLWGGTANGYDVLYDMWMAAERAVTQRRIFIGWWRNERYQVQRETALFDAYGTGERTADERLWIRAIRAEYGVEITDEQVAWRRYQLAEKFRGDEDLLSQEHPNLWPDAFVSFGDKFIKPGTIRRLRAERAHHEAPSAYRYRWASHFNYVRLLEAAPHGADLLVWEQPAEGGVYVLGAKPPDDTSDEGAITVWRAYPDLLRQVAEYVATGDTTYQFAWALIHLAGAYSRTFAAYVNLELGGTGFTVMKELDLLRDAGWGLSTELRARQDLRDVLSSFREYLFRKPDSFGKMLTRQWRASSEWRPMVLHGLRDCLERGAMQLCSEGLLNDLAAVRRGGDADPDQQEGARVISAALAARHYLDSVIPDIDALIPNSVPHEGDPLHVGQYQVQHFIRNALAGRR